MSNGNELAIRLRLDGQDVVVRGTEGVGKSINEISKSADVAALSSDRLGDALQRIGRYGAGFLVGSGLIEVGRQIAQTTDAYTNLESRLKIVTAGHASLDAAMVQTFGIAQATRQSWDSTAELYGKLSRATGDLGLSQQQLGSIVTTVNQAVLVSGGSAQSSQAALVQLGQAFASGTLRGEELNSILEQTPRLAQAIADGMGVSTGALRKMGEEGELSAERVSQALQRAAQGVAADFNQMAPTVSGAMTQISNSMLHWVGTSDTARGANAALANGLTGLANNFEGVARTIEATAAAVSTLLVGGLIAATAARARHTTALIAETTAERAAAQEAVKSIALNVAMGASTNDLTAAKTRLIAAEGALAAAQSRTLAGKLALAPAIAALGGPVGATITGLIALGAAFMTLASSAEAGVDRTKSAVADEGKAMIEGLQKQIDKIKERNELAGKGLPATDELAELSLKTKKDNARLEQERARYADGPVVSGLGGERELMDAMAYDEAQIKRIDAAMAANNKTLAETTRLTNERTEALARSAGPSKEYEALVERLTGTNRDFAKSMNAAYTEFNRLGGAANTSALKTYANEVRAIWTTMGPAAAKKDHTEHEAAVKRVGDLIAKDKEAYEEQIQSIIHQTSLIGKTAEQQAILNAQRKIELDLARDLAAIDREKSLSQKEKAAKRAELTGIAEAAKARVAPAVSDQVDAETADRGGKDLIALQAKLDARILAIQQSQMSETEMATLHHEETMQTILEAQTADLAAFEGSEQGRLDIIANYNAMAEEESLRHQAALGDVAARGEIERRRFELMSADQQHALQQQRNSMSAGLMAQAANNAYQIMMMAGLKHTVLAKAMFIAGKAAAIGQIFIDMQIAKMKVMAQTGLFGIPMATWIDAAGYSSMALVAAQTFQGLSGGGGGGLGAAPSIGGGGGGYSGSPAGGYAPPGPTSITPPARGEAAPEKTVINLSWYGTSGPSYKDFVDNWVPMIETASKRGALEFNISQR